MSKEKTRYDSLQLDGDLFKDFATAKKILYKLENKVLDQCKGNNMNSLYLRFQFQNLSNWIGNTLREEQSRRNELKNK